MLDTQRKLLEVYLLGDEDMSGTISHEEFENLHNNKMVAGSVLQRVVYQ